MFSIVSILYVLFVVMAAVDGGVSALTIVCQTFNPATCNPKEDTLTSPTTAICATNGVMYSTRCEYLTAKCIAEKSDGIILTGSLCKRSSHDQVAPVSCPVNYRPRQVLAASSFGSPTLLTLCVGFWQGTWGSIVNGFRMSGSETLYIDNRTSRVSGDGDDPTTIWYLPRRTGGTTNPIEKWVVELYRGSTQNDGSTPSPMLLPSWGLDTTSAQGVVNLWLAQANNDDDDNQNHSVATGPGHVTSALLVLCCVVVTAFGIFTALNLKYGWFGGGVKNSSLDRMIQ
eukprot:PhF_6_TR31168/c0_g1_i2/m.45693